jgi:SOCS box
MFLAYDKLIQSVSAPLSLQQLTRTAVHAALQLPLPKILRDYLLSPDLDLPDLEEDFEQTWDQILQRKEVCHMCY